MNGFHLHFEVLIEDGEIDFDGGVIYEKIYRCFVIIGRYF